ncbi:PepSY domain-containing protein [Paenochrobactrum sp. BZR 588]|uniref:PepSY domain-containing protein n=1 Tax=unclassified Paenochrobactrum TaxID=2639760 RepID=UPI003852BB3D
MNIKTMTLVAACICVPTISQAQTTPTTDKPAVVMPDQANPSAPVKGENSFTQEQAKSRMEEAGFTNVMGLTLDDDGVWHAAGEKDGTPVMIKMDYQGNVTSG